MKIRQAVIEDAPEISLFLQELVALGKRTSPADADFVSRFYITHSDNVRCNVAEDDDGSILGFQILTMACQDNVYDVAVGWGIIGTHIRPSAARRGVGKALFAASIKAAKEAGIDTIDASIAADNIEGLAYYEAIGFRAYREYNGSICKRYEVAA